MHQLIITRILKRGTVTLSELEARATERGLSLSELYAALDHVHKDKRITQTSDSKGNVIYRPATMKQPKPMTHLAWVNQWYKDNEPHCPEIPFPEIRYPHLFLRTKEERDQYKAAVTGRPVHMIQSYSNGRRSKDTA